MTTTVLQAFLRESLLDLDGDDSRLQKLQAAATALAQDFAARTIGSAIPIFLAALGKDDATAGEKFAEVASAVEAQWSTYKSAFKDGGATTLYKAVSLQALVEAIAVEPKLGTAIALLMRNLHTEIAIGKYAPAVQMLVDAAEKAFASECKEAMAPVADVEPGLAAAAKPVKVDRAQLQKRLEAAAGPHNRGGQPGEDPNSHWPNAGNPWSFDFTDRLTTIVGDYIDLAMARSADLDAKNQTAVGNAIAAVAVINPTVKRSTALLWWRQALYSESADQPYRSLGAVDAVIHSVIDLASHVPPAYERALDSFLTETVLALDLGKKKIDVDGLRQLSKLGSTKLSESFLYEVPQGMVISAIVGEEHAAPIATPSLLPQQWAVWLMREFMALQAVQDVQEANEEPDAEQ